MSDLPSPLNIPNFLEGVHLPVTIPFAVYGVLLMAFIFYTFVILYHWIRYAEDRTFMKKAIAVYGIVSAIIIGFFTAGFMLLSA